MTVSTAYTAALTKGNNYPTNMIAITVGGVTYNCVDTQYRGDLGSSPLYLNILKSVTSIQNKLNVKSGYSTIGNLSFVLLGRDNVKPFTEGYTTNMRVDYYHGFDGALVKLFTGKIINWKRKGDTFTFEATNDLTDAKKNIPEENVNKTQTLDYRNTNPVDIMSDILSTQLEISTVYYNSTKFSAEKSVWLPGWKFDRVLTKPEDGKKLLSELQRETNSFIFHDGERISYKVFSPIAPNSTFEELTDNNHFLDGSITQDAGLKDNFYNRVIVLFDYDESGNDNWENYESVYITADAESASTSKWNTINTKEIKSKWMRSYTYEQPTNITGVTLYHVSIDNGLGSGTLTFATGATADTLSWTAPNGSAGSAVAINKSGQFQLFDTNTSKSVRVVVEATALSTASTSDAVTISQLNGGGHTESLAGRLLMRYRNPASEITFDLDINNGVYNGEYIKPTDIKGITSNEAYDAVSTSWDNHRVMLTSVKHDMFKNEIHVEAIDAKVYSRYGFIAPERDPNFPDYSSASISQKEYGYIANSSGELGGSTANAYFIW